MTRSVCIFCSASNRIPSHFKEEGYRLGRLLAEKNIQLVFGGGDCGIMGAVAKGVLDHKGKVLGVFPRVLEGIEPAYKGLTELIEVADMHTRKKTMFDRADAFVILPGGFGTMDETFEVLTWKQLATHRKPVVLYNYQGYWDNWIKLTDGFIDQGFAPADTRELYSVAPTIDDIFIQLKR